MEGKRLTSNNETRNLSDERARRGAGILDLKEITPFATKKFAEVASKSCANVVRYNGPLPYSRLQPVSAPLSANVKRPPPEDRGPLAEGRRTHPPCPGQGV